MNISKPELFNPDHFFNRYIACAPKTDLKESLDLTEVELLRYMEALSEKQGEYAYEQGKWTVKQVLQHINDTERIMGYRALRISRKDTSNIIGFDENKYAENDFSDSLTIVQIGEEFKALRASTKLLFSKMNPDVINFSGRANDFQITPKAIGWIISGHCYHHLKVLNERYLFK